MQDYLQLTSEQSGRKRDIREKLVGDKKRKYCQNATEVPTEVRTGEKHWILTKCDEDVNSTHDKKKNNEDFSLKFRFLCAASNCMHAGYEQANKLIGILGLCH